MPSIFPWVFVFSPDDEMKMKIKNALPDLKHYKADSIKHVCFEFQIQNL